MTTEAVAELEVATEQKPARIRYTNTHSLERLSEKDRMLLLLIAQAMRAHAMLEKDKEDDEEIISLEKMLVRTLPADFDIISADNIRRCLNNARSLLMNFAGNLKAEKYIRGMVKYHRIEETSTVEERVEALLYFYEAFTFGTLMGMRVRIERAVEKTLMTGYEYDMLATVLNGIQSTIRADEKFTMLMGEEVALIPRYIP